MQKERTEAEVTLDQRLHAEGLKNKTLQKARHLLIW